MRPRFTRILLFFTCFVTGACLNISSFQTGRTVGKNQLRLGGGVSTAVIRDFSVLTTVLEEEQAEDLSFIPLPSAEISARYGLTDQIDIGVRIYTVGVGADLKTQFIGDQNSPLAVSLSASANYFGISIPEGEQGAEGDDVSFDAGVGLLDMATALHASYSPGRGFFTFYASPKFVSRTLTLGFEVANKKASAGLGLDLVGSNFGVALGRNFTVYLEAGAYTPIGFQGLVSEFGLGFDF